MRFIAGAAVGERPDLVEQLQAADQVEGYACDEGGSEHGDGNVEEAPQRAGAVDFGGFVIRFRDVLEAGQVDDHGDADELERVDGHDDDDGAGAAGEPVQPLDAEKSDDVVECRCCTGTGNRPCSP